MGLKVKRVAKVTWEFVTICLSESSIHGLNQLSYKKRHPAEQVLWCFAIGIAVFGAFSISKTTWVRFRDNPTVVSMETNWKDWNTSVPAATVCLNDKFSEEAMENLIMKNFSFIENKENLRSFLKELSNMSLNNIQRPSKTQSPPIDPATYWKILNQLRFPFVYTVSNSNPDAFQQNNLSFYMTEKGYCYSYNSIVSVYNEPWYWEQNMWKVYTDRPVFQGNPLDGDIFAQILNMNAAYEMAIHDPCEVPDVLNINNRGEKLTYKSLTVLAQNMYSTPQVKKLNIKQRKCRLIDESNLKSSPFYSYNVCRIECRKQKIREICGCIPHFYRPLDNIPTCDFEGLECVKKHNDLFVKLRDPATDEKIPCSCYPTCEEMNYIVESDNTMHWLLGTSLKWTIIKYPTIRFKRDVLFGLTDLFVSIGGTAALFLGCSILSFLEIAYFATFRLFWFIRTGK